METHLAHGSAHRGCGGFCVQSRRRSRRDVRVACEALRPLLQTKVRALAKAACVRGRSEVATPSGKRRRKEAGVSASSEPWPRRSRESWGLNPRGTPT